MTINIQESTYQRKLENRIKEFSGSYMNDAKWFKLFFALSNENHLIKKCLVKDIWDNVLREIEIPSKDMFDDTFGKKGIKDVCSGGPSDYLEIEKIIFPSTLSVDRKMRNERLSPFEFEQNIKEIKNLIEKLGVFELEYEPEALTIYGYK